LSRETGVSGHPLCILHRNRWLFETDICYTEVLQNPRLSGMIKEEKRGLPPTVETGWGKATKEAAHVSAGSERRI
jgi:hypothetical protein